MKYKYFTDEEVKGLVEDIVHRLDRAREYFGHPIVITSGYRDPNHNAAVGGVGDSSHTTGKAVDIRVPQDQEMRERLIWSLGLAGFNRMGAYPKHIHCDVDKDKVQNCFWVGNYDKKL